MPIPKASVAPRTQACPQPPTAKGPIEPMSWNPASSKPCSEPFSVKANQTPKGLWRHMGILNPSPDSTAPIRTRPGKVCW